MASMVTLAIIATIVEIEVAAHKRVIRRPRWRPRCACASSPTEVSAPPAPRLFAGTPCGTSVWARFLFERYACFRPLNRVAAWLSDQGLPLPEPTPSTPSPGLSVRKVGGILACAWIGRRFTGVASRWDWMLR